jgi:hypothetical protein
MLHKTTWHQKGDKRYLPTRSLFVKKMKQGIFQKITNVRE